MSKGSTIEGLPHSLTDDKVDCNMGIGYSSACPLVRKSLCLGRDNTCGGRVIDHRNTFSEHALWKTSELCSNWSSLTKTDLSKMPDVHQERPSAEKDWKKLRTNLWKISERGFICDEEGLWRRSEKYRWTISNSERTNALSGTSVWWVTHARRMNTLKEFYTQTHENWWTVKQTMPSLCSGYIR